MKLPLNQEVSSKICYNHEKDTVTRPIGVFTQGPTISWTKEGHWLGHC